MRILSLDGGGIRGIMPSMIIEYIESFSNVPVSDMFDLIIGTSTGAIISCILTVPNENGRPKFTATDIVNVYKKECVDLFCPSRWKTISSAYGIYGNRFSLNERDKLFMKYLGNTTLSQTIKPLIIPAFELNQRTPTFFKTRHARNDESKDLTLANVLAAALAAPTVFPPHVIENRTYMDALYMKNPTLAGVAEAMKHGNVGLDKIHVFSLGTGYVIEDPPQSQPSLTGLGFLLESFNGTVNANTISTQYITNQLVGDRCLRIDFGLPEKNMAICDVTADNLAKLQSTADAVFWDNMDALSKMLHIIHPVGATAFDANVDALRASKVPLPA